MKRHGALSMTGKEITLLVILLLFLGLFAAFLIAKDRRGPVTIVGEGDRAPEFTLSSADGRSVSLSQFRGKVVMVHFWATWCPPCVEEMPTLQKLQDMLKGDDFVLLAVSVDEGGRDVVSSFLRQQRLSLPVLLDPDKTVANRHYGTFKFPETYVIDREGIVRRKIIGSRDWSLPVNVAVIRELLAGR